MAKTMRVNFPWPYRGMNQNWPANDQPALSTPESLNVMTDEPQRGRSRGGSRNGTKKAIETRLGDGTSSRRVTGLLQVTTTKIGDDIPADPIEVPGTGPYQYATNTDYFRTSLRIGEERRGFEEEFTGWQVSSSESDNDSIADYLFRIGRTGRDPDHVIPPLSIGDVGDGDGDGISFWTYLNGSDHGSAAAWRSGNYTNQDEFEIQIAGFVAGGDNMETFISCRVNNSDPTNTAGVLTLRFQYISADSEIRLTLYKGATSLGAVNIAESDFRYLQYGIRVEGDQVSITEAGSPIMTTTASSTLTHRGVAFGTFRTAGDPANAYFSSFRVLARDSSDDDGWEITHYNSPIAAMPDDYVLAQASPATGWKDGTRAITGDQSDWNDFPDMLDAVVDEDVANGGRCVIRTNFLQPEHPAYGLNRQLNWLQAAAVDDNFELRLVIDSDDPGAAIKAPCLMIRIDGSDEEGSAGSVIYTTISPNLDQYQIRRGTTVLAYGELPPRDFSPDTSDLTVALRVTGDVVRFLINGFLVAQATITGQHADHHGIGFGQWFDGSNYHSQVKQLRVYTQGGGGGGGGTVPGNDAPGERERVTSLITIVGEDVYVGLYGEEPAKIDNVRDTQRKPCLTDINGKAYLVDGESYIKVIDPLAVTATDLNASAGSTPENAYVCCNWRSRLVVSGITNEEQNVYMSRAGDPEDWNYAPATPDALQAVALNASEAGRIGQPVVALVPWRDDVLVIGCDHGIYQLTGDPAAGGTLDAISEAIGFLTRDSWCMAPDGTIYFVGTAGFYRMRPGTAPENLAIGKMQPFFQEIDRNSNYVMCVWERDRVGCYIFIVPRVEGAENTSLWFDAKQEAFWPIRLPTNQGPLSSIVFDGDAPTDRYTLLGGHDGYVRRFDKEADQDDGVAISSYVFLGPVNPGGAFDKAKLIETEFTLGVPTNGLDYELRVGADAAAAIQATADFSGRFTTSGRQEKVRSRARGNTFLYRIGNTVISKAWTLERVDGVFDASGRQR